MGAAGNLSHRRPHRPPDLARERTTVGERTGTDPATWQMMRQVHGVSVAVVDRATPSGYEHRDVDALATRETELPLVVQVADCVPVLLAGPRTAAAVHAGRRGVQAGIIGAALRTIEALGDEVDTLEAAIGPAIGGCCYEVPASLRSAVADVVPEAAGTTSWGTPSLDLKLATAVQLSSLGVRRVRDLGICTRCDRRFFSHRRDPEGGRQIGLVVRPAVDR